MVSSFNRPPTTRGQRVDQHKSLRLPATASVNLYGIREAAVGSPSINAMKSASEKTNLLNGNVAAAIFMIVEAAFDGRAIIEVT